MQIRSILTLTLAALSLTAMAQKKGSKKHKKTTPAAVLTPALKSVDGKTFSYALGVAQGESLKQYLISREGVDTAYLDQAMAGMNAKISDAERKKALAYAAGLRIADINKRNLPMFNKQAAGKADSAYVDEAEFERALTQVVLGQGATLKADSAMKIVEGQMKYQEGKWKAENEAFLAANGRLKGVKTLPSGLQYRVLTEGKGAVATDSTECDVHYEGSLIDGTVFDSSYKRGKPATFRPDQVIKGWKEALTKMPEGSVWNLYIPAPLGYGERGQGQDIPGNSTLIFKVELIKVNKPAATEAAKIEPVKPQKSIQPVKAKPVKKVRK